MGVPNYRAGTIATVTSGRVEIVRIRVNID